jgi:hypothetical protein
VVLHPTVVKLVVVVEVVHIPLTMQVELETLLP